MNKQKHFYLIKGLIREAEHWGEFPKILKEQFPEAKISFIDIPGAGEFVSHKTPLSVPKSLIRVLVTSLHFITA